MLGVSRASAGEMLKRLEAEGLIERGEQKEALLTAAGPRARRASRAQAPDHRAAAHRLHGLHGRRGARARGRARRHVHRRDGRADRREARPSRPLPARLARRPRRRAGGEPRARRARRAEPGTQATIVRLAEHDGELLHWFYDQGLVPGTSVVVRAAEPAADSSRCALDGGERAVSEKAAAGLFVRPRVAVAAARPAAARSASALSVRSHVKSASSRPKWPYAAVFA